MLVARVWMTRRMSTRPARSTHPTRTPTRTSTRRASWSRIWRKKNENESEKSEKEKEKRRRRKTTVAHIPCGSARKSTMQSRRRSRK
jgi:hypothetical protein